MPNRPENTLENPEKNGYFHGYFFKNKNDRMAEKILRDVNCKTARPADKPYRLRDGGGLYLQVRPTGGKYWQYRYARADGKDGLVQLGPYPKFTLEEARKLRDQQRDILKSGADPAASRKRLKARRAAEAAKLMTFKQCATSFIASHSAGWRNPKHEQQWTNTLTTYAYPVIGELLPDQVDTDLVLRVLEPIWATKNETASRLRGRIEAALDWAKARGLRDGENPARWRGHLDQLLPKPSKVQKPQHHAAMRYESVNEFCCTELRLESGSAARALEFLILTAMRTNEVLGAQWSEIDLDAAVWTAPAERMKGKKEHRVPLSTAVVALLKTLPRIDGCDYLFEGRRAGRPLSNMALLMLLRRMGHNDMTAHGFRSTFRDWAAECTAFPNEVAEMALAHTIEDKTESAYRRGDLFTKRRKLMQAWSDYVQSSAKRAAKGKRSGHPSDTTQQVNT